LARASANAAQRRTHAARWQSRAEAPPGSSAWAEVGGLCCLPHAAPIGLRAVDADFDGISVEGHIAKLALAGVVIAHDTCVEDRHQGHGSGALVALRALRGTHAAGPAWGGWGAGWRHWLPPQRDEGDFNFQLGFRTEHQGSSTPEVSFATPIFSCPYRLRTALTRESSPGGGIRARRLTQLIAQQRVLVGAYERSLRPAWTS
jgi:hypothetical protein